jgi:hypothetical protein
MRKALPKRELARASPQSGEIAAYWDKALECRERAERASDPEVRDVMLQLANQWMQLVIFANDKTPSLTRH